MDKAAESFIMLHNTPDWYDALITFYAIVLLVLVAGCIVWLARRIGVWLERERFWRGMPPPPMATRLPRAERRPDAMQKQMDEEYRNACDRG